MGDSSRIRHAGAVARDAVRDRLPYLGSAMLGILVPFDLVWAADAVTPASAADATVTDRWIDLNAREEAARYRMEVVDDSGHRVDFRHTDGKLVYDNVRSSDRITVWSSTLTGRPVAVDTAEKHLDLRGEPADAVGHLVLMAVLALFVVCFRRRASRRMLWALFALGFVPGLLLALRVF